MELDPRPHASAFSPGRFVPGDSEAVRIRARFLRASQRLFRCAGGKRAAVRTSFVLPVALAVTSPACGVW